MLGHRLWRCPNIQPTLNNALLYVAREEFDFEVYVLSVLDVEQEEQQQVNSVQSMPSNFPLHPENDKGG